MLGMQGCDVAAKKISVEDYFRPLLALHASGPGRDHVSNCSFSYLMLVIVAELNFLYASSIASALPWIASDFGKTAEFNWIVSAFNLTSAAFIPCWAQMTDVFGRNASLNAAIIFMLIGSALCTGAPTSAFPVLLLGRGFQGMAAAGLNVCSRTIIADKVSLKENAKTWSLFALTGGISYAIGPVIGGELYLAI